MLSPVPIDYDPSNGSWNVFCIEVRLLGEVAWELLPFAFQTHGHAMNFFKPQLQGEWKQLEPGGMWHGFLHSKSAYSEKGREVRIQQLVMVFDGHAVPSRRSA